MIQQKFTDKGSTNYFSINSHQIISFFYSLSNTFNGVLSLLQTEDGGLTFNVIQQFKSGSGSGTANGGQGQYFFRVDYGNGQSSLNGTASVTLDSIDTLNAISPSTYVNQAAQPESGAVILSAVQVNDKITLKINLSAALINVVRNSSGSFGSLHLLDVIASSVAWIGCKQNYIGYIEGATLTGGAGNAQFEIAVATAAIPSEENGVLDFHSQNVGTAIPQVNVAGTTTGQQVTTGIDVDASNTQASLYLNFSGTAASILANSTIAVTGIVKVILQQI